MNRLVIEEQTHAWTDTEKLGKWEIYENLNKRTIQTKNHTHTERERERERRREHES